MTYEDIENKHAAMVATLAKAPQVILESLTAERVDVWHAATGVATEAGEALGAAKAFAVYSRPLDRENLVEELGDIEFYLEMLRTATGITRAESLTHNMRKLAIRYPSYNYSDEAANLRADKQDGQDTSA